MTRRTKIACIAAVVGFSALAGGIWWYRADRTDGMTEGRVIGLPSVDEQTDKRVSVEELTTADPQWIGKWQNTANPQWFKCYYDDPDEDREGYFWGKEWDEDDDVFEEDLCYHGNGWFIWKKQKNRIIEVSMSEYNEMMVPQEYDILSITADSFALGALSASRKGPIVFHKVSLN